MKIKSGIISIFFILILFPQATLAAKKISLLNRWPYSPAKAIAEDTNHIILGDGDLILILNKTDLSLAGKIHLATSEGITGVYRSGDYVYATTGHKGLDIVNISNPANPSLKTIVDDQIPGQARAVFVDGAYSFVASTLVASSGSSTYLNVFDVSGTGTPPLKGNETVPQENQAYGLSEARGIAVSGGYAYLADYVNGIHVFHFDPASTVDTLTYTVREGFGALDFDIAGSYLFGVSGGYGMQVINISDPANPAVVAVNAGSGSDGSNSFQYNGENTDARSIDVSGTNAFIVDSIAGLEIINITDPAHPSVTSTLNQSITGAYSVYASTINASTLYMTDYQTGLTKIDTTNDSSPSVSGSTNLTAADTDSFFLYSEKDESTNEDVLYGYALNSNGAEEGMRILKFSRISGIALSEFDNISLESFLSTPGEARDAYVFTDESTNPVKTYAYLADGTNGLVIVDVTDKGNPQTLYSGNVNQSGFTQGQGVISDSSGTYIFVADGTNGLRAIKAVDKTNPEFVKTGDTPGTAEDVILSGYIAYVADGTSGLEAIDILPTSDTFMDIKYHADIPAGAEAKGIDIFGNYAYLAAGSNGLLIVDINPTSGHYMKVIGTIDTPGDAGAVYVNKPSDTELNPNSKTYAYVADGSDGVRVIDVSDPEQPRDETEWDFDTQGTATDIAANTLGSVGVVADGSGGLTILSLGLDPDSSTTSETTTDQHLSSCFISSFFY